MALHLQLVDDGGAAGEGVRGMGVLVLQVRAPGFSGVLQLFDRLRRAGCADHEQEGCSRQDSYGHGDQLHGRFPGQVGEGGCPRPSSDQKVIGGTYIFKKWQG